MGQRLSPRGQGAWQAVHTPAGHSPGRRGWAAFACVYGSSQGSLERRCDYCLAGVGCTFLMFSAFSWGRRPCSRRPFYSRLGRAINVAPRSPRVFLLVAGICSGIKSPLLSSGRKTVKTLVVK